MSIKKALASVNTRALEMHNESLDKSIVARRETQIIKVCVQKGQDSRVICSSQNTIVDKMAGSITDDEMYTSELV